MGLLIINLRILLNSRSILVNLLLFAVQEHAIVIVLDSNAQPPLLKVVPKRVLAP